MWVCKLCFTEHSSAAPAVQVLGEPEGQLAESFMPGWGGALNLLFAYLQADPGLDAKLAIDPQGNGRVMLVVTALACDSPDLGPYKEGEACTEEGQAAKAEAWATFLPRGLLRGMFINNASRAMEVCRG